MTQSEQNIRLFSTCPPSNALSSSTYIQDVRRIAIWSELAGCEGILVYANNALIDPWLTSQVIITATSQLRPLVALQPIYMHPYTTAKMISSIALLHHRQVHLNMLAGGFTSDLIALNDHTKHDERYVRLVEYTQIVQGLLRGETVTTDGGYYAVHNLKLAPSLPRELMPDVFVSGSSDAGMAAGRQLKALAVEYPGPVSDYRTQTPAEARGMRIGIVTRSREEDAWRIARERFPEDRKGQITHQLAMKMSDSSWHSQLSQHDTGDENLDNNPYWLLPFKNYKTFCPYLVGSYERVARELADYVDAGYRTFILDVPESPEELEHIRAVFKLVREGVLT